MHFQLLNKQHFQSSTKDIYVVAPNAVILATPIYLKKANQNKFTETISRFANNDLGVS